MSPPLATIRNRYRVAGQLGAGGMGTVYAVEDVLLGGARVALKAHWPTAQGDGSTGILASLREEFRVLALLRHPRLSRVFDFGRLPRAMTLPGAPPEAATRGGFFFTRELVEGQDLGDAAAAAGRDCGTVCRLLADAAQLLHVLHAAGLRHGDFKPQNAIVDPAGDVHLIDFGLAAGEGESRSAGTFAYLAPELAAGRPADRRADLYALGITLYELCTGERPSGALRGAALIDWHRHGVRPRLAGHVGHAVGGTLDTLLARLWAPDPEERLPSAAEAHAALSACAHELGQARAPSAADRAPLVIAPTPRGQVAALEQVLERRLRGQGGAALVEVVGDAGAGKSALLLELSWRAQLAGAEVVRGARAGAAAAGPYAAIAAALDQVAALSGRAQPLAAADAPASRFALFERVSRFLVDAASAFPLVLVLDDVDRCDEGTRALARYLAHALPATAPVLLVAARAPVATDAAAAADAASDTPRVVLAPLTLAEVRAMLARAAERDDEPLARRLHEHTGGNLLHVVDTLRALAARGFPPGDSLRAIDLPARLEDGARAELAAASAAARAACEPLAVLGRPAPDALLAALGAAPEATHEALATGLVARDANGALWFARAAIAQACYQAATPARREKLHAACARALPAGAEAARHEVLAGDVAAALDRGLAAAEALARVHDHAAALELCEAILRLVPADHPAARDLRLRTAELARLAGDVIRVAEYLAPFLAEADGGGKARAGGVGKGRVVDRTPAAAAAAATADSERDRARVTLARARDEAGDPAAAVALFTAVRAARPDGDAGRVATRELARLHIKRGNFADAVTLVEETLARLPATDPAHELRAAAAFARGMQGGDAAAALTALDAAAGAARAAGDRPAEATAWNYSAILAFRRADYGAARVRYQAALTALGESGEVPRLANLRMNLASLLFHQGEYARCLALLGETVALLRAVGADTVGAWARRNLGHLYVELGAYEQARAELRAAQADATRLGLARHRAATHALLGIVASRTGDAALGRAELQTAQRIFEESGDRKTAAEVVLDLAELELASGPAGASAARALLGEVVTVGGAAETEALDVRAHRHALAAEIAAALGDDAGARAALQALTSAIEEVRAQGGRHLEWTLHVAAQAAARAVGEPAAAEGHRAAAVGLLETMALDLPAEHRATFWNDPRRRALRTRPTAVRAAGASAAPSWAAGRGESFADSFLGERGAERLYRVLEIYRRLNSELDLSRLLELAMDAAVELTGAERGFLLLADPAGGALRVAVARNLAPAGIGVDVLASTRILGDHEPLDTDRDVVSAGDDVSYSRSIAERVFASGEPVIAQSAQEDERFATMHSVHALRLESVLCIPVRVRGRTAGVLYLENRFHAGRFSRGDLRLLMAFGDQVAIALENARLLGENARRAADLAAANTKIEELYVERGKLLAQRTEELAVARRDLEETRRRLARGTGAFGLVGRSPAMEKVLGLIGRLAATDVPVLIEGESGTGKELVARALHANGPRRKGPLVSVNCGALPDALLESELFGHVRGAFTGADRDRRGLFQAADGGTLFLDEVGDTPARMQADLLRALQDKTIRPVGSSQDVKVDVRIIAAGNRPLEELVKAGKFREDLFYRLHVVAIVLPPLRDRPEDIPLLVDHFLDVIAVRMQRPKKGVTRAAMRRLVDHPYPGNVRQLEHLLMNACVLADREVLDVPDLESVLAAQVHPRSPAVDRREKERAGILAALEACGWNKSKAAEHLGLPRRTFYRRLAQHRID